MNTPKTAIILNDSERQPSEVWTRVMGYHRPVSQFNRGKKQEHAERLHFRETPDSCSRRESGECACSHAAA